MTVTLAGWLVIEGATLPVVTVRVAGALVTLPPSVVTITRYCVPFIPSVVAGVVYVAPVAPAIVVKEPPGGIDCH